MAKCINADDFSRDLMKLRTNRGARTAYDDALLEARGFDPRGNRSGGITNPQLVTVPEGAVLIRTFGGGAQQLGQWWLTPAEMCTLMAASGHMDFQEGRAIGQGLLHAHLAILRLEWDSTCDWFSAVTLLSPFLAFYGEGDHALTRAGGTRKVALIYTQRRQRGVRQLFIPNFGDYASRHAKTLVCAPVDTQLAGTCIQLGGTPLDFER